MEKFSISKITLKSEDIAKELRRIREERKIDIAQVAKTLRINKKYLEILESGEYDKLPPGTYGGSFLREYAGFLGINNKEILNFFSQSKENKTDKKNKLFVQKTTRGFYFLSIPKIIKNILIIIAVVVCLFYLSFYINRIVSAPELKVVSPDDNISLNVYSVEVSGIVDQEAELRINEELILPEASGFFKKEVDLKTGLNTVIIRAKKKYSKENTIIKKILVDPNKEDMNY